MATLFSLQPTFMTSSEIHFKILNRYCPTTPSIDRFANLKITLDPDLSASITLTQVTPLLYLVFSLTLATSILQVYSSPFVSCSRNASVPFSN